MKFILPSRVPQYDFQFQLLASQDYWTNFKERPLKITYVEDSVNFEQAFAHGEWNDYCPVGSIEFCNAHKLKTVPRNIPISLKDYAAGLIANSRTEMKGDIRNWHVKSNMLLKHPKNGVYSSDNLPFEDGEFQAVEYIENGFASEWRVFVFNGDIVDIQNYAGDLWTLPDKCTVEKMIYKFEHTKGESVPPAYTLDVGVYDYRTYVIEVHDFYACGTYNFNDHYRYPMMLWEWFRWFVNSVPR